jgi:short-subunit dehydrogenase
VADLTAADEVARCAREALTPFGRVDVLVNNAGSGLAGPFAQVDAEQAERVLRLNVTAPILLTRALLPAMLSRQRGWIVNVASIAGHVGVRDEAVYAATKAALLSFGESLRYEVTGSGVGVTNVSPGVVSTPFFERRGRPYDRAFPRPIPPDRVARAVMRGLRRGTDEVFVPGWMRPVARFHGGWPSLFRQLAGRFG